MSLGSMKIKVGIFFGGPSREREISFAGGRTVYDNLNKELFEPIPIFVDANCHFIQLDWQYIYKGSIRDFFPPVDELPDSPNQFQIYQESLGELSTQQQQDLLTRIGTPIPAEGLRHEINIAFLALHGVFGEDGKLQQLLHDLGIPYTGSGVRASRIGFDKVYQKELMEQHDFAAPRRIVVQREDWLQQRNTDLYTKSLQELGDPIVVRPATQGSSIGVSIVGTEQGLAAFTRAVDRAFFSERFVAKAWKTMDAEAQVHYLRNLNDLRDGLGFPLRARIGKQEWEVHHPESLLSLLRSELATADPETAVQLIADKDEQQVVLESFIDGNEFSCIVIRTEDGGSIALPPTEILKGSEVFDYRSKYMPGYARKETPIKLDPKEVNRIRQECTRLFDELDFQTYARIDGFYGKDGKVYLNDPNTTSGMLPSSFFFHQAAEIGLNPSQFLTYIIRISLQERVQEQPEQASYAYLLRTLDTQIEAVQARASERKRVAIILGGYSFERHISVESGRNIYEKLASSDRFEPIPLYLIGDEEGYQLFRLPINLLLKDNADDIRDKILYYQQNIVVEQLKEACAPITRKYASEANVMSPQRVDLQELSREVDVAFIALHGRPGEDGQLQMDLQRAGIPYNGSPPGSAAITINKYKTLQKLKAAGLPVAQQLLLTRKDYEGSSQLFFQTVEQNLTYPLVAKPVDDGCSSAVIVIRDRQALQAYTQLLFRPPQTAAEQARKQLGISRQEEFPIKSSVLFESMITDAGARQFMEITTGLITEYDEQGTLRYTIFEPSESLASGEVLSLQEKFLAGEGQNITPARLGADEESYQRITGHIKRDLERAARLLGVEGYARIDAFVRVYDDDRVETIIIEVNSLPGHPPPVFSTRLHWSICSPINL